MSAYMLFLDCKTKFLKDERETLALEDYAKLFRQYRQSILNQTSKNGRVIMAGAFQKRFEEAIDQHMLDTGDFTTEERGLLELLLDDPNWYLLAAGRNNAEQRLSTKVQLLLIQIKRKGLLETLQKPPLERGPNLFSLTTWKEFGRLLHQDGLMFFLKRVYRRLRR